MREYCFRHGKEISMVFFLVVMGALVAVLLYADYRRKQRLVKSGIATIDRMDGRTFEQYLELLFRKLGYEVKLTRYVGDYGADLIITRDGVKTAIQAKRHTNPVGIKAVQEVVAAKGMYNCTKAMVVTNSTFTQPAMELARSNGVILYGRARLIEAILSVSAGATPIALPSTLPHATIGACCTDCGTPVSDKVAQYCRTRPKRFGGQVVCFQHQNGYIDRAA
jgi:restriction system protein